LLRGRPHGAHAPPPHHPSLRRGGGRLRASAATPSAPRSGRDRLPPARRRALLLRDRAPQRGGRGPGRERRGADAAPRRRPAALAATARLPRPIGHAMGLSDLAYAAQGWVVGTARFSAHNTAPTLLAYAFTLTWTVALLIVSWRMPDATESTAE